MKIVDAVIVLAFFLLVASTYSPPVTDKGYLKPPIILDPVSINMIVEKKQAYPYEPVQHYASYNYAMCYEAPVHLVFEVDVDPRVNGKPNINYRYNIPVGYDFTSNPTSSIDILDNIGYTQAYRFKYDWWVWCSDGTREIGYVASGGLNARGYALYSGAGDPTGPDFIEPTDYDYFVVTGTGGLGIGLPVSG
ncbi:MAG: hypothetical protein LRS47_01105 [Desulfurococcales archaeon]|nr:hypothetical protein [Desulfurococcales archaeon]